MYLSLLDDVVGVGARESSRLQEIHHIGSRDHFLVQEKLVLLGSDHSSHAHLIFINLEDTFKCFEFILKLCSIYWKTAI